MGCKAGPGAAVFAAIVLLGCGPAPKSEAPVEAVRIKDLTSMLPTIDRTGTKVIQDHMLDIAKLPGGTLGDYDAKGTKFQMFVIDTETDQKAAFLLLDAKGALQNPEYIAYMGGYFGSNAGTPVYVFSKTHYLAGVSGLTKDIADPIARVLAARLH